MEFELRITVTELERDTAHVQHGKSIEALHPGYVCNHLVTSLLYTLSSSLFLPSFGFCLSIFFQAYPTKTKSVESAGVCYNFVIVCHPLVSTASQFFSVVFDVGYYFQTRQDNYNLCRALRVKVHQLATLTGFQVRGEREKKKKGGGRGERFFFFFFWGGLFFFN